MNKDKRKHMRIALSAEEYEKFTRSKLAASEAAGIDMTDPQYAVHLIRWAVKRLGGGA